MEDVKLILEKIIRIMLIVLSPIYVVQAMILFKWHLDFYPAIIKFYPHDILLLISTVMLFLMIKKFRIRYLGVMALVGIILACTNLFGFDILLNIINKI